MDLQSRFNAALEILRPGPTLVVGVSGGLDSMALLDLLQSSGKKLVVTHFNHQLRAAESDGDEAFVREESKKRGFEFRAGRGDVRAEAKGISIEMAARKLRHAFLAQVARSTGGDIVLAHHADDQIELVVMRSVRNVVGFGSAGMRAESVSPADSGIRVLRPLLRVRKNEIREFVKREDVPFREDSSNALLDAERNRIRHKKLPLLRAAGGAEWDARTLEMVDALQRLENEAREFAKQWTGGNFLGFETPYQNDIIAIQLERAAIPVTASRINTLRNNIAKVVMIRPGVVATLNPDGILKIHEKPVFEEPISINLRATLHPEIVYAGGILEWDFPWPPYELKNLDGWMIFDRTKIGDSVIVRHPQPGDRVRLSGRSSARPLMDVLSRNKVPREQRERVVLATTERGEIFWVEGLRIIEDFKVTDESHDGMDQSSPSLLAWRWRRKR